MPENGVMDRKKQIFQLDGRLKDRFNEYCSARGLIQEDVLEALVYLLVERHLLDAADRDNLLRSVSNWKAGEKPPAEEIKLSPGEAGRKVDAALRRGPASLKRSRKGGA